MSNSGQISIQDINARLKCGEAVVITVQDLKAQVREGKTFELGDIDVVTTATHGIMSGSAASFSIPVAPRGKFDHAVAAWINGVPA